MILTEIFLKLHNHCYADNFENVAIFHDFNGILEKSGKPMSRKSIACSAYRHDADTVQTSASVLY